jgi:hypothetical protein
MLFIVPGVDLTMIMMTVVPSSYARAESEVPALSPLLAKRTIPAPEKSTGSKLKYTALDMARRIRI